MRVLSMNLGIIRAETGEMEAFYGEKYKNEGYKRTGRAAWRTAKSVQGIAPVWVQVPSSAFGFIRIR